MQFHYCLIFKYSTSTYHHGRFVLYAWQVPGGWKLVGIAHPTLVLTVPGSNLATRTGCIYSSDSIFTHLHKEVVLSCPTLFSHLRKEVVLSCPTVVTVCIYETFSSVTMLFFSCPCFSDTLEFANTCVVWFISHNTRPVCKINFLFSQGWRLAAHNINTESSVYSCWIRGFFLRIKVYHKNFRRV